MINKIYIVGPVASGKTTLAKKLSKKFKFAICELDNIVHIKDPSLSLGNTKRSDHERDFLITSIISGSRWIVEDTGRNCFNFIFEKADLIILLEPHPLIRKLRIVVRWFKQKLKIEKCNYKPNFKMLKAMFKWSNNYDSGEDGLKNRLIPYKHKLVLLKNKKDILKYTNEHLYDL